MNPASNPDPSGPVPTSIAEFVSAYPRRSARLLAGVSAAALLWHFALPGLFYRNSAFLIEGPFPALAGAAVALWLHRADRPAVQALAACGWAFLAGVVAIIALGLPAFGPLAMLGSLVTLARNALRVPFADVLGSPYAAWLFWMGVKTVLAWGALAYGALLYRRHGVAGLRGLWSDWREERNFDAAQREERRAFRRLYNDAVKSGGPLPAAPRSLVAPAARSRTGLGWAQSGYWLVRIAVALVGAGGLYAFLSGDLRSQLVALLFRGWFG